MFKTIIQFLLLIIFTYAHATFYPMIEKNEACVKPKPAKIWSWHIHLLFF